MIVHAALPVNTDPAGARGFEITDLPEIAQAATILHRGSMDNVMATIQTLARWIDENGYRTARAHHACMTTPTASRRAKRRAQLPDSP